MKLQIKPEFQAAMFPLSPEEKKQLEENIVEFGCLDPIKEWVGCIVDGHNRFEICTRLGIEFKTVPLHNELNTVEEVLDWIDKNQLGRRNLTPDQMRLVRGRRYNREKKAVGAPEGNTNRAVQCGQNVHIETIDKTAQRHAEEAGVSERTIRRDAAAVAAIEPVPELVQAVQCGNLALNIAAQAAELPAEAISEVLASPEPAKAIKAHVANNSGNNEWYTPAQYVNAARHVMGGIDTDPASCEFANQTVQATTYYTAETNGLDKPWPGRVWMNPPYAQPLIAQFSKGLVDRLESGETREACVLVNNATETEWFQTMSTKADALCLIRSRVKFLDPQGQPSGCPLQGQVVLYFGVAIGAFEIKFGQFGDVWVRP